MSGLSCFGHAGTTTRVDFYKTCDDISTIHCSNHAGRTLKTLQIQRSEGFNDHLNPNDAADAVKDRDGDGYTNIEEYINSVVKIKM